MNSDTRKIRLIMELRQNGISDQRVLSAIETVPREKFVPAAFRDQAYENVPLPIGCEQTISQPLIVAAMTQALEVGPRHKVLEIGTGSGYQAAVLAKLCRRLYTIERHRELLRTAEAHFLALNITNITAKIGDGSKGWPEQAPFDRILVTAAAPDIPGILIRQLRPEGVMVVPVGRAPDQQHVLRIHRHQEKDGEEADPARLQPSYDVETLWPVRFVPLVGGRLPDKGNSGGGGGAHTNGDDRP